MKIRIAKKLKIRVLTINKSDKKEIKFIKLLRKKLITCKLIILFKI